jgi:hypothetical protein
MKKRIPFLVTWLFIYASINCFSQGTYHYELLDKSLKKIMAFSAETMYSYYTNDDYFTFKTEDDSWHIYTMKGRKITDTLNSANQYSDIFPPNENGHCIVKQSVYPNPNLFGVIDTLGKIIIPVTYSSLGYNDGMYAFYKNDKIGFLNKLGKEIISPTLYKSNETYFSDGFALVWDDAKRMSYFINKEGKPALSGAYEPLGPFNEGLASVTYTNILNKQSFGYIDKKGTLSIKLDTSINKVGNFENGMAYIITKANKLGFIDKTGKITIPCIYDGKETYMLIRGNTIVAAKDGKFYTLTKTGEVIAEFSERPYFFGCGYAQIGRKHNWGLINLKNEVVKGETNYGLTILTKNNLIVCPSRSSFEEFTSINGQTDFTKKLPISFFTIITKNGKVLAPIVKEPTVINDTYFYQLALDKKYGLANLNGKLLFEKNGEVITYSRKHVVVKENNAIAAVNTKGEYTIKSGIFTAIGPLVNTYTWAKKGKTYFFIDSMGTIISQPTDIDTLDGTFNKFGIALAKKTNSKWGYINYKAEFITPVVYDHTITSNDDTWRTTDDYADNTLLKANNKEGRKGQEYDYTYYTSAGKEFKSKLFNNKGLNYKKPTLTNKDNDDFSFYLTGNNPDAGGAIITNDGKELSKDVYGRWDELVVNNDTLTVYFERRVPYSDKYEVNESSYLITGKELIACTNCKKQTTRFAAYNARQSDSYRTEMLEYVWNNMSIKSSGNSDGAYCLKNKNGKKIKYTTFESFKTVGNYAILESDLKARNRIYDERFETEQNTPSSKGSTMSARWINETKDFLSLFEIFSKSFNTYKDARTNENVLNVSYWLTKLIDSNTTITNILRHSNDGSMSKTEQDNYLSMAQKKSEELNTFRNKLGNSDVSVLDALIFGLTSGLGGR